MVDAETEKKIVSLLYNRFNKWWNNQKIEVPSFKRRDFKYLWAKLGESKAITLIGPRQVGKTTLAKQLIASLIEAKNVPPKRILYVQLDDTELRLLVKENLLYDILSVYQRYVLLEDINTTQQDVYLFFDEVQRAPDWAEYVKSLLAANKKIHILSTGSASFPISQRSKETLPGRQELYTMLPLKFIDALFLSQRLASERYTVKGVLNVGDSITSSDGQFKARLDDTTPVSGPFNFNVAIVSFIDRSGNPVSQYQITPGMTIKLTVGGKPYKLKVFRVSVGNFAAKWAEMGMLDMEYDPEKFTSISYELRRRFIAALEEKSFSAFAEYCKNVYIDAAPYERELQAGVEFYLSRGGYPEIVTTQNASDCQRLIRGYANDVILKDMMPWFKIRDFDTAEKLLFLLASVSGEKLNVRNIRERISGSNPMTLDKYINYLQNLFLVRLIDFYSGSKLGSPKQPKVYFLDAGFRNGLLGILDSPMEKSEQGHAVESVVCDHLLRLSHKINDSCIDQLSCYGGKKEVDFILNIPKYSLELPIEVKFRQNISPSDLAGLKEFMEGDRKAPLSIVVTEQTLELRGNMLLMPLWMFLIMC